MTAAPGGRTGLERMLRCLAEQPNRFQVHAETLLRRKERQLRRKVQAAKAESLTIGVTALAVVQLEASNCEDGKDVEPEATTQEDSTDSGDDFSSEGGLDEVSCEPAGQPARRGFLRGITCDVPARAEMSPERTEMGPPQAEQCKVCFNGAMELPALAFEKYQPRAERSTSLSDMSTHASTETMAGSRSTANGDNSTNTTPCGQRHGDDPPEAFEQRDERMVVRRSNMAAAMICDGPMTARATALGCSIPNTMMRERSRRHTLDDIIELISREQQQQLADWPAHQTSVTESPNVARWPQDIMDLLPVPGHGQPRCQPTMGSKVVSCYETDVETDKCGMSPGLSPPLCPSLRLYGGAHNIPHPEKASSGGADSWFVDDRSGSLGIADGVGEWEWRFGVNARAFADELMLGCRAEARKSSDVERSEQPSPRERALRMLQCGFASSRSFGSATALVGVLDRSGQLGVANLGDSSLLQLRRREVNSAMGLRCINRTQEMQHAFNCPYQLSKLPTPEHFPALLAVGMDKLVRAIQRKPTVRPDEPEDSELYCLQVQQGDLLVLGTDGVFDNLYTHEVCQLASQAVSPLEVGAGSKPTDPARIAEAIAKAAFHRSIDRNAKTPFGDRAREAGCYHTGGKMDDISCVCAWVLGSPDAARC